MKTIVIGWKAQERFAAQDFWKKLDAGEFEL